MGKEDSLTASVARLYRAGSENSQEAEKLRKAVDKLLNWMIDNLPPGFKLPFNCSVYASGEFKYEVTSESKVRNNFILTKYANHSMFDLHSFATLIAEGFLDVLSADLEEYTETLKNASENIKSFIIPIETGTQVMTTKANMDFRSQWSEDAWEKRRWGVRGKVIGSSDGHGLCYEVRHNDGSVAYYDPTEIVAVK